ncbi:Pycsar system effector family protein [Tamlana sp. I1]|uniref:Pycsar system effector family protein n=1 Tax=Tamlana sp. I1 TaxID=2762061 RepID=UPI00188F7622|nr:Pycsar system effector family protein [Tamlana sp. I1]
MEKDRLKYTIDRFDHYFDSVNNKSAVYIAINTFITGGIIVLLTQTDIVCEMSRLGKFSIALLLFIGISSLILLSIASIPLFSKKPDSLYYFGAISRMKQSEFNKTSKNYTDKDELQDLRSQTYILADGLTKKFTWLKLTGIFLVAQFLLLFIILIIILINL